MLDWVFDRVPTGGRLVVDWWSTGGRLDARLDGRQGGRLDARLDARLGVR